MSEKGYVSNDDYKKLCREIKWKQIDFNEFKNIPKVHIDNQNIGEAVRTVFNYLKDKNIIS